MISLNRAPWWGVQFERLIDFSNQPFTRPLAIERFAERTYNRRTNCVGNWQEHDLITVIPIE